jgi:16S rRNA (guanine527-N7)-methyltransferase
MGLVLAQTATASMWRHLELLREANERFNLTRVTDCEDAALRHYADSLAVSAWLGSDAQQQLRVFDVGTGGGFPAIPLAIVHPTWSIVALDGTGKKVRCVQAFAESLGLGQVTTLHRRAEDDDELAPADIVLFRAVAAVERCLGWARSLCRPGGRVVCYKSAPLVPDEATGARRGARRFGFKAEETWPYQLGEGSTTLSRQLCIFRKIK